MFAHSFTLYSKYGHFMYVKTGEMKSFPFQNSRRDKFP